MKIKCQPQPNRMTLVGAVHLFLTTGHEDILLARRINTGYHDGWYSVPAGHIEPGESATESMVREATEEIGIIIEPHDLQLAHVMHRRSVRTDCTNSERIDLFFTTDRWRNKPRNLEPMKCDSVSWHFLSGLPCNLIPYVQLAIKYWQSGGTYSEIGWDSPCPVCGQ